MKKVRHIRGISKNKPAPAAPATQSEVIKEWRIQLLDGDEADVPMEINWWSFSVFEELQGVSQGLTQRNIEHEIEGRVALGWQTLDITGDPIEDSLYRLVYDSGEALTFTTEQELEARYVLDSQRMAGNCFPESRLNLRRTGPWVHHEFGNENDLLEVDTDMPAERTAVFSAETPWRTVQGALIAYSATRDLAERIAHEWSNISTEVVSFARINPDGQIELTTQEYVLRLDAQQAPPQTPPAATAREYRIVNTATGAITNVSEGRARDMSHYSHLRIETRVTRSDGIATTWDTVPLSQLERWVNDALNEMARAPLVHLPQLRPPGQLPGPARLGTHMTIQEYRLRDTGERYSQHYTHTTIIGMFEQRRAMLADGANPANIVMHRRSVTTTETARRIETPWTVVSPLEDYE